MQHRASAASCGSRGDVRRGPGLLPDGAGSWPRIGFPSAEQAIRERERLVALEARLPAVLSGEDRPDAAEALEFALLCYETGRHAASVRLLEDAFADRPSSPRMPNRFDRYNAACSAALAAAGEGRDAPADRAERGRLRRVALGWLEPSWPPGRDGLEAGPAAAAEVLRRLATGGPTPTWRASATRRPSPPCPRPSGPTGGRSGPRSTPSTTGLRPAPPEPAGPPPRRGDGPRLACDPGPSGRWRRPRPSSRRPRRDLATGLPGAVR